MCSCPCEMIVQDAHPPENKIPIFLPAALQHQAALLQDPELGEIADQADECCCQIADAHFCLKEDEQNPDPC